MMQDFHNMTKYLFEEKRSEINIHSHYNKQKLIIGFALLRILRNPFYEQWQVSTCDLIFICKL